MDNREKMRPAVTNEVQKHYQRELNRYQKQIEKMKRLATSKRIA